MALFRSLRRATQLQKCIAPLLVRSSTVSVSGCKIPPTEILQVYILRRPQQCMSYCSQKDSEKKSDSDKPEIAEEVDIGPGTWKEVYQGILTTQIRMIKLFSLSTSIIGVSVQPLLIQKFVGAQVGFAIAAGSFVGFFTFVTPFLLHWITKRYVTRLEYDPKHDLYSATTLSFFLQEKKIRFSVDDVKVPGLPGVFTTFHVRNKPLFVEPRMFDDIEHYGRIMGYDKPMDFSLKNDEEETQK